MTFASLAVNKHFLCGYKSECGLKKDLLHSPAQADQIHVQVCPPGHAFLRHWLVAQSWLIHSSVTNCAVARACTHVDTPSIMYTVASHVYCRIAHCYHGIVIVTLRDHRRPSHCTSLSSHCTSLLLHCTSLPSHCTLLPSHCTSSHHVTFRATVLSK